ncbi:DUF1116 domain-containing protein [Anaerocolumna aminovalerica]|uniref:DUF1116 domain-containing protein n=1 Tax=Anaerocolumna aminovalerica TaxID=1527 RepID=UPI000BE37DB3|nr:DUF1116 domain-containing protein [Anaerocolumna aminovalerica]
MSKLNTLFQKDLHVVNFGIESFYKDLKIQNIPAIHIDWKPIAGGDKEAAVNLRKLKNPELYSKIQEANKEALRRILAAQPVIIGLGIAGEVIPGMTKETILHAGPPITWERMCGPQKGAVLGGLVYEGLAADIEEAGQLAASGKITFAPCNMHNGVGPMAGVVTYSMPVWILENKTFGNRAYCTINEGLGKVLRFGAFDEEVLTRLRWIEKDLYPVLKAAMEIKGEIDIKTMIAQLLQMGDEGHNRNKAGTSLLFRELTPAILEADLSNEKKIAALNFINSNDHTFLNISMPACKCTMDPVFDIEYCTVAATMCRNGTDFGIRIAGLGKDVWFTAPAERVEGLLFPGFREEDEAYDLGDSCITETAGIGGFCMAAAPAIVQFVGGQVSDAKNYTMEMYEITIGEGTAYKIPGLDFRGAPTGIDLLKVIETGIRPIINTGIAHKEAGVGQVGAGLVHPPEACFKKALAACVDKWSK